jgi:hypothetical protein
MADLLFWFLVSQTIAGLPSMVSGTEVRIVSTDLLAIYATAQVTDERLTLEGSFQPNEEVRVLILQPDATPQETVEALGSQALFAHISPEGDDILVQFQEIEGPLSFGKWLLEERGIMLRIVPVGGQ